MGTANGVSIDNHGGKNELLGGTGQGNIFSDVVCRDIPCIIFRRLEKNKIVILIKFKHKEK